MTLREVTRTVTKLVEDASGCPVVVNEDRSLMTLAASRIARGTNRIHSISFNPSAVREPLQHFYDEEDSQGPCCRVASGARTTTA